MDQSQLLEDIKALETRFTQLKAEHERLGEQRRECDQRMSALQVEMLRLQGENRALQKYVKPTSTLKPVEAPEETAAIN